MAGGNRTRSGPGTLVAGLAAFGLTIQAPPALGQAQVLASAATPGGTVSAPVLQVQFSGGKREKIRTTLDAADLRAFTELQVARKPVSGLRNYQAWPSCSYSWFLRKPGGQVIAEAVTLSSSAVPGAEKRLLVSVRRSIKDAPAPSTALIGADGKRFDYNWVDLESGERYSPELINAPAPLPVEAAPAPPTRSTGKGRERQGRGPALPKPPPKPPKPRLVIDPVSYNFPAFLQDAAKPGDLAGYVRKTDDTVHAELFYAGLLTFEGQRALLLQAIVNRNGQVPGGAIMVGYYIIRADTLMPLRRVWQAGQLDKSELIQCH